MRPRAEDVCDARPPPVAPSRLMQPGQMAPAPPPRRRRRPKPRIPSIRAPSIRGYIAGGDKPEDSFAQPASPRFVDTLGSVEAFGVPRSQSLIPADRPLKEARGYRKRDLQTIAKVAHHYLFTGAHEVALAIYDGLAALDPAEAHYALGLGLAHDRMRNAGAAHEWYQRAETLNRCDGRPDVNRAELFLQDGELKNARQLLASGQRKAAAVGDTDLEQKAAAILAHIDRSANPPAPRALARR